MSATDPCPTCPWRLSSKVGGGDIPQFSIDKMRGLANTVGDEDAFRPIMACHYSGLDGSCETPCVGYLAQHGWSNLSVRLAIIEGRVDRAAMFAGDRHALWPDFHTMLAAYEEAQ